MFCPGDGLYGLRGQALSASASFAIRDLGKPLFVLTLRAPEEKERPECPAPRPRQEGWQGIEHEKPGPYRWTSRNRLIWEVRDLPAYPCTLRVRMPFVNQIEPGFAASSRIVVGESAPSRSEPRSPHAPPIARSALTAANSAWRCRPADKPGMGASGHKDTATTREPYSF
jgi:hypothetical protein